MVAPSPMHGAYIIIKCKRACYKRLLQTLFTDTLHKDHILKFV